MKAESSHQDGHDHSHDHDHDHDSHAAPVASAKAKDDGHGHDHDHHSHARDASTEKLRAALILTTLFLVVEATAGIWTGSLALLSDAGHMLADSGALAIALVARVISQRPRTDARTFGYRRAETLASLINAALLGVGAVWVVIEAVHRWKNPPPLHGGPMFVVAVLGLLVNLVSAYILSRGREGNDANTRAALAHVISDAVGSVGAIVAAVCVLWFDWRRADPVISVGISLLIATAAWALIRQATDVLMEGVPPGVKLSAIEETIRTTEGVREVHDLHVWRISDGFDALMAHVVIEEGHSPCAVAAAVSERVRIAHKITHSTVQPEASEARCVEPMH